MNNYKIINSKFIDNNFLNDYIKDWLDDLDRQIFSPTREVEDMAEKIEITKKDIDKYFETLLSRQYMNEDIKDIFKKYGEEKVIKFLMYFVKEKEKYKKIRIRTIVTEDEIEQFIKYSKDRNVKPTNIPLNAKNFLKMCRVCYDAAPIKIYPKGVSDYFIYQDERGTAFHEDSTVLDKKCYEDDNNFRSHYPLGAYHFEEIRFGGPSIFIKLSHYYKKVNGKTKKINTWSASFSGSFRSAGRGIKMFNALRKKGYPITINQPEKMLYDYLGSDPDDSLGVKYFYSVEDAKKYVKGISKKNKTNTFSSSLKGEKSENPSN